MILSVCAIRDEKAHEFLSPSFDVSENVARRNFENAIAQSGTVWSTHRADFTLYKIADYDTSNASFAPVVPPSMIVHGGDIDV